VEMYMFPGAILPTPYARFLKPKCGWRLLRGNTLIEPNIGDDGDVTHQPDFGRTKGGVETAFHAAKIEIEAMKLESLNQLTQSFRFESGKGRVAKILIRLPIRRCDRGKQAFGQL